MKIDLKDYQNSYKKIISDLETSKKNLSLIDLNSIITNLENILNYWRNLDEKRKNFLNKAIEYFYTWEYLSEKAKKNLVEKLLKNFKYHFLPLKLEEFLKKKKEEIKSQLKYLKRELPKFKEKEKKFDLEVLNYSISSINKLEKRYKNIFKKLGLFTIKDILFYFPRKYEDRKTVYPINLLNLGDVVNVLGYITSVYFFETKKNKVILKACLEDETGKINLIYTFKQDQNKFFNFYKKFFEKAKNLKIKVIARGKVTKFENSLALFHPEVVYFTYPLDSFGNYFPIYPGYSKVSFSSLIKAFEKAVSLITPYLPEYLPEKIKKKYNFPSFAESLFYVHIPNPEIDFEDYERFQTSYHKRLYFDELFLLQLLILKQRALQESIKETEIKASYNDLKEILDILPFKLTKAQEKVIKEILKDLENSKIISRLIQGDVGSGKTIIAIITAYLFAKKGYQVAVMCPTEILAYQHYLKFKSFLEKLNIKVGYLVGSLKPSQKKQIYKEIENGDLKVVIGTHALFQKDVKFKNLKLVIIDEQHRFGVEQRLSLKQKAKNPHILVMTATPIPRTLALTLYGDLDISVIDELPQGRKKIITKVITEDKLPEIYPLIFKELKEGRKVYVIYPLIEENEKLEELKSLKKMEKHWKSIFKDFQIFCLHGKMKDEDKYKVMQDFKNSKKGAILLSTTVVEVGVDVPEATIMIIENAERFGLSQLHQLRGRVGRGPYQSYCFLIPSSSASEKALKRLSIIEKYDDGFKIAEEDLKLRGSGEIFGIRQSGKSNEFFLDINNFLDVKFLEKVRKEAEEILKESPDLSKYPRLKKMLKIKYPSEDIYLKV